MNFAERLKKLITARQISNYRLSKELNITEGTIRSWLKKTEPRGKNLHKLAAYFNIHPAWLLYGDKKNEPTLNDDIQRIADKIQKHTDRYSGEFKKAKINEIERVIDALTIKKLPNKKASNY